MVETHFIHTVKFWQCFLQQLKASRAPYEENLIAMPRKRLVQVVKHIVAQSQCGLLLYFWERRQALWLGLLSSASAGLQPGDELLCRLVLQVGAHITGVGAVRMASE